MLSKTLGAFAVVVAVAAAASPAAASVTLPNGHPALAGTVAGGHQALAGTAATSHQPLIGVDVANGAQLAQDVSEFGPLPVLRVFSGGVPSWGGITSAAKSVVVTFDTSPSVILSGSDDAALRKFFDTAPAGHQVYWGYMHEPEVPISVQHRFTLSAYLAAWSHLMGLAAAAHNANLHSTVVLEEFDLRANHPHGPWQQYVPKGIQVLGWDAYADKGTQDMPPSYIFGPAVAASKAAGKPFGFAEFGMLPTAGNLPAWLTAMGNYLVSSGATFGTLFDAGVAKPSMRLTSSASISAWKAFVQRSYKADG